jgi:ABC-type sugar transport system ATPase subunit
MQRVAIARALVHRPALVLADEPTGNLDPDTADAILTLLQREIKATGACAIMVTHSQLAAQKTDKILHLSKRVTRNNNRQPVCAITNIIYLSNPALFSAVVLLKLTCMVIKNVESRTTFRPEELWALALPGNVLFLTFRAKEEQTMNVRQKKLELIEAMNRARALEPSSFVPNKLLDTLIEKMNLKNDAELCRVLEVQPPIISKIRHRKLAVGATILLRMHEKSDISIRELKDLSTASMH